MTEHQIALELFKFVARNRSTCQQADAAAVMERYPCRAGSSIQQCVEQRPVGYGIGTVAHGFGLAVGACDGPRIQMIAADDYWRLQLAFGDHLVEFEPGAMTTAQTDPTDAG